MASMPSTWRNRRTFVCNVLRALTGGAAPHSASSSASTVTSRGWVAASAVSSRRSMRRGRSTTVVVALDAERPQHAHEHSGCVPMRPGAVAVRPPTFERRTA